MWKPHGTGDPVADGIVAVKQMEPLAERRLEGSIWSYVAGGAGDEHTLAANSQAWQDITLAPRVMRDVSSLDTTIEILGTRHPHPILIAPTATHGRYHPGAEAETLTGALAAETTFTLSSLGSTTAAELSHAVPGVPFWMQVYIQRDRDSTARYVTEAVRHGASALLLTVDTPTLGARDRDKRNNLGAADGVRYPTLAATVAEIDTTPAHRRIHNPHLAADLTWSDLEWLVDLVDIPVLVKGVLRPDDAHRAIDHGAGGIIVSNHGARNLDTAPATAVSLPRIATAAAGRVPLLVDGGMRRGTDVAKALCLGADAVLVGRPVIWGLSTYGAAGVTHVIEMLRTEFEMAMSLLGAASVSELSRDLLWE